MQVILGSLLLALLFMTPSSGFARSAEAGILDLTRWDPEQDGALSLNGNWQFFWQVFLSEEPEKLLDEGGTFLKVPGVWNRESPGGLTYPTYGYATYRLVIRTGRDNTLWALDTGAMHSSGRVYINNRLVFESGKAGKTKTDTQFHLKGTFLTFLSPSADIDLRIEVANFDHNKGGLGRFRFGTAKVLQAEREVRTGLNLFVIGAIALMILYHVALFALRPQQRAPLYFACAAFTNCLFHLVSGGWIVHIAPHLSGEVWWDCFFTAWYIGLPTFSLFVASLYPKEFGRTFLKICIALPLVCIVWVWLTPLELSEKSAMVIQLFGFVQFFYLIWVAIRAHLNGGRYALVFIAGACIYFVTIVHDILASEGLIDSPMNSYFGLCAFIFFQSYMIAARFSQAFTDLEIKEAEITELNAGLERKVKEKTREIRSIMSSIKQGIFTIGRSPSSAIVIQSEYSKHLETMLKTKDIAGRPPLELMFSISDLNSEQKAMTQSIVEAALDEDVVNFEVNSGNLPAEIRRRSGETAEEVWEIDWTPVVNQDDQVEQFLISLRDVTSLKQLQEEAIRQQKELEYISEIVNVSAENFQKFIKMSRLFLDENERLIRLNTEKNTEIVKILFINMHTIKGNARSYHFRKMSGALHEVEQYYAELLNSRELTWDRTRLLDDLAKARLLIDRYESINRDKLGRNSHENQVLIERSIVADKINSLNMVDLDAMTNKDRKIIEDTQSTFKTLFYDKAVDVLEEILSETERLARDLKKNNPSVQIQDNDFTLTVEAQELFRSIFTHIIRNSLDHGLETPEERIKIGKPPTGKIEITLQQLGAELLITYHDDGRGLNLARLAKLGQEKERLDAGKPLIASEVANLIFCAGLSTSAGVTEISGRGVGMDAVKRYLEDAGGRIHIRLDRPQDSQLDYRPFTFEIRIPQHFFSKQTGFDSLPKAKRAI